MKKLKYYLKRARKEKWAVGQFNFSNLEILKAIISAAEKNKSPVILGTSEGESSFFGLWEAGAIIKNIKRKGLFLNLDHGKSFDYLKKAIEAGYDAVHFDGSKLSLKENINITKKIVKYAHQRDVLVEGEINYIKGGSQVLKKAPEIREQDLTDPEEATRFIKETGVDSLAVNIGTFHGIDFSGKIPNINITRLKAISKVTGGKFLVLHGGSGVSNRQIKSAVKNGITKININTELRVAYIGALKRELEKNPEEIKPYKIMPKVIRRIENVVNKKIKLFGSQNKYD